MYGTTVSVPSLSVMLTVLQANQAHTLCKVANFKLLS